MKYKHFDDILPNHRTDFAMLYFAAYRSLRELEATIRRTNGGESTCRQAWLLRRIQNKFVQMIARLKATQRKFETATIMGKKNARGPNSITIQRNNRRRYRSDTEHSGRTQYETLIRYRANLPRQHTIPIDSDNKRQHKNQDYRVIPNMPSLNLSSAYTISAKLLQNLDRSRKSFYDSLNCYNLRTMAQYKRQYNQLPPHDHQPNHCNVFRNTGKLQQPNRAFFASNPAKTYILTEHHGYIYNQADFVRVFA